MATSEKVLAPFADGVDSLGADGWAWNNAYTKHLYVISDATTQKLTVKGEASIPSIKGETDIERLSVSSNISVRGNISANGTITAEKVFNAVYNDYAEWFERGDDTKEGEIVALDETSNKEQYVKATNKSKVIVGICTGNYAHIIGGENHADYEKHNLEKYIPISLAGRVPVYVKGAVYAGDYITPSNIPGVGKPVKRKTSKAVGIALESSANDEIKLIKVLVV